MRGLAAVVALGLFAGTSPAPPPIQVASPDGQIVVRVALDAVGQPSYAIARDGRTVLEPSRLGLVRDDADFSRGLRVTGSSATRAGQRRL